jgi:hypothetical protein
VFGLLLASGCLGAFTSAAAEEDCSASVRVPTQQQSRQVLLALSEADQGSRREVLEQYLANPPTRITAVERVALNRSRLALAADYLTESRFPEARQLLSAIELDSPIAVQASLLLAESFQLEGDHARSAQWMLRTGQRYGADPDALKSMLERANELRYQGEQRQAFALYNMVQSQILSNAEQVGSLRSEADRLIAQLLRTRLDESRAAQSQMLKQMINDTDSSLLMDLGALARSAGQRECLEKQQRKISETAFENSAQQARITPFLTMLDREEGMMTRRLEQLGEPTQPDQQAEQAEIRQQLEVLRSRRQALLDEQQQLPGEAARTHRQIADRITALDEQNAQRRQRIREQLDLLSSELMARYRELAAESQYGRATLLAERHRGG